MASLPGTPRTIQASPLSRQVSHSTPALAYTPLQPRLDLKGSSSQIHWLQLRVKGLESERADLLYKLSVANGYLTSAQKQLGMFYTQCNKLAKEVGERRQKHIDELCPPVTYFDPQTMSCRVAPMPEAKFAAFKRSMVAYARQIAHNDTGEIVFVSRPPSFLPICIKQIAQHGYWFPPVDMMPLTSEPFELVVESAREQWMYIGRYQHFALEESYSMTLSEWAILDEETKNHQCIRMLRKSQPGIEGVSPHTPALLALRAKLDMAEYAVPCAGLKCVGYDTAFEAAVGAALGGSVPSMEVEARGRPDGLGVACGKDLSSIRWTG